MGTREIQRFQSVRLHAQLKPALRRFKIWSLAHFTCNGESQDMNMPSSSTQVFQQVNTAPFPVDILHRKITHWSQAAKFFHFIHNICFTSCIDNMHSFLQCLCSRVIWQRGVCEACARALSSLTPIKAYSCRSKLISYQVICAS